MHAEKLQCLFGWSFLYWFLSYIPWWFYFYYTHLKFLHLWESSEKEGIQVILERKKTRAENAGAAALLLCTSDWGIGPAFSCCSSLALRRCSGGSQTAGTMLFISEIPTAPFSSQRRSGEVLGIPESAARGTLARPVSEPLHWAGLGVRMYVMSANWSGGEKIMFSWHFSKGMWCFFFGSKQY